MRHFPWKVYVYLDLSCLATFAVHWTRRGLLFRKSLRPSTGGIHSASTWTKFCRWPVIMVSPLTAICLWLIIYMIVPLMIVYSVILHSGTWSARYNLRAHSQRPYASYYSGKYLLLYRELKLPVPLSPQIHDSCLLFVYALRYSQQLITMSAKTSMLQTVQRMQFSWLVIIKPAWEMHCEKLSCIGIWSLQYISCSCFQLRSQRRLCSPPILTWDLIAVQR